MAFASASISAVVEHCMSPIGAAGRQEGWAHQRRPERERKDSNALLATQTACPPPPTPRPPAQLACRGSPTADPGTHLGLGIPGIQPDGVHRNHEPQGGDAPLAGAVCSGRCSARQGQHAASVESRPCGRPAGRHGPTQQQPGIPCQRVPTWVAGRAAGVHGRSHAQGAGQGGRVGGRRHALRHRQQVATGERALDCGSRRGDGDVCLLRMATAASDAEAASSASSSAPCRQRSARRQACIAGSWRRRSACSWGPEAPRCHR
jgi:hypothetical protein